MKSGTVKFFNAEKGYGFVKPDDGGEDLFVHISKLKSAGLETLRTGHRVRFESGSFKGKMQVESIQETGEPDVISADRAAKPTRRNYNDNSSMEFRQVREYKEKSDRGSFSSKSDFDRSYDRMWRSIRDSK